jgi:hypothetical protein
MTAREVCEASPSIGEMIARSPTDEPAAAFARALAVGATPEDAVAFCAHALSPREAVWWACGSVRSFTGVSTEDADAAFQAAQAWVDEPDESHREAALTCGLAADRRDASAWVALAAGWSGGTPATGREMTGRAVTVATLTALTRVKARERRDHLQSCLALALRLLERAAA